MKNILAPAFFIFTLAAGFSAVSISKFYFGAAGCTVWDKSTLNRPLFRLKEARMLLGREVRVRPESLYKHSFAKGVTTGRIIHLEMVASDRVFVMVYWDGSQKKGEKPDVRLYDRETIRELDIIEDNRPRFTANDISR